MTISPAFDSVREVWTLTTGDTFDFEEIVGLLQDTDWKGAKRFLWDLRALTKGPDSTAEIQAAADLVSESPELSSGLRLAVVVSRDLDFGVARMFGAFAERFELEYRVFREKPSALDWLASPGDASGER